MQGCGCVLLPVAGTNPWLSWFINGKWFDIKHFLSCILFLAFSNAWDQVMAAAAAAMQDRWQQQQP
jgi:hypothetical protein